MALTGQSFTDKRLTLTYQPPLNWEHLLNFYRKRAIKGVEEVGEDYYYRTFVINDTRGWFRAQQSGNNALSIEFEI